MNLKKTTYLTGFILSASALAGASAVAKDDTAQNPFAQFAACAEISGDAERLVCYDGLAQPMRKAAEIAPVEKARNEARTQAFGAESFADKKELEKIQRMSGIESPIANLQVSQSRLLKVTLENGQVWRQHHDDRIIPTPKPGEAESVLIRRTMIGHYIMHLEPKGRKIRVIRIK